MGHPRGLALAICIALAALGAATTAHAEWGPVERPAAPAALEGPLAETNLDPAIAVSPAGERLLAWTVHPWAERGKVEVTWRTRTAAWSTPVTISGVGPELYMGISAGFEPSGQARVLWGEGPKWPAMRRKSTRGADGVFDSVAVAWVRRYPRLGCAEIETAGWERAGPASQAPAREPCPGFDATTADPPPPPPGARPRSAAQDTIAPALKLYAPQRERTLTTRRLALKAWSDEACRLVFTARLAGHTSKTLGRFRSTLQAHKRRGLALRLTRTGVRRLKRAFAGHTRGSVRLTVSAADASGNTRVAGRRIVLTR